MEKNKIWFSLSLCLFFCSVYAQKEVLPKKYFVYFKDKSQNTFSIEKPEKFLGSRSLERRRKQKIAISERDLPVSDVYLTQLKKTSAKVIYTSKWLNGALIECSPEVLAVVEKMSFILPKTVIAKNKSTKENRSDKRDGIVFNKPKATEQQVQTQTTSLPLEINRPEDYGRAFSQAQQLGVEQMHLQGFRGQGMIVAIFDAGFSDADKQDYFKHLFDNQQIMGTYDFVMSEKSVFEDDSHGRMVLSCMAAYQTGKMVGTAPEASFYLFRTEDSSTEYRIEEYNWLRAAEVSDSLGVDIINSSLGYNVFDDASTSYTRKDMDGKTSIIAQAAEFASATGILVVSSAGNEGDNSWGSITTPGDAQSVLSVGAVGGSGDIAYFSSRGNTSDNRIKPDVVAYGQGTTVGGNGTIGSSNGTSFSSPVMAGFVAGFWQANPNLTNKQVREYITKSANQASKPDSIYGFGIPNFIKAQNLVKADQESQKQLKSQNVGEATKNIENTQAIIPTLTNNDFILMPSVIKTNENVPPVLYWGTNYVSKDVMIKVLKEKNSGRKKKMKTIVTIKAQRVNKDTVLDELIGLPKGTYTLEVTPSLGERKSVVLGVE